MPPDEPNDEERLEELPQDNGQTPFQPAAPSRDDSLPPDDAGQPVGDDAQLGDTHPDTDTDIDRQELYDAGESTVASGADEPHDDPTVVDYQPPDKADSPS